MKKERKVLRKVLIGLASFIVVFLIGGRIFFRVPVRKYYKSSEKAFVIPGIKNGFVAQGLSYDAEDDYFYVTGYMKNGSASPIYVVSRKTGKLITYVYLAEKDGSIYDGHCGGLSVYGDTIYVAGGENKCLLGFKKDEIRWAEKKSVVKCCEKINLCSENDGIGVAFTTVCKDMLFAGEFYRLPSYPTLPSHTEKCADGENHAIMIGLSKVDDDFIPTVAYSLPDKVQGLCFAEGKIYVSTSWSVADSNIYIYDESKLVQSGTKTLLGKELPLYILDSNSLVEIKVIPPMSEEIEYVDGQFYIMNESASNKYIFGKFTGGRWCYKSEW